MKKLILLAPAFNYINVGNAADYITGWFSSPNKKEQPEAYPPLPADFTSVFMNVVDLLKQDAAMVECPVLILHGTEDDTIAVSSSRRIYKKNSGRAKGTDPAGRRRSRDSGRSGLCFIGLEYDRRVHRGSDSFLIPQFPFYLKYERLPRSKSVCAAAFLCFALCPAFSAFLPATASRCASKRMPSPPKERTLRRSA